jgi:hypothetical protein
LIDYNGWSVDVCLSSIRTQRFALGLEYPKKKAFALGLDFGLLNTMRLRLAIGSGGAFFGLCPEVLAREERSCRFQVSISPSLSNNFSIIFINFYVCTFSLHSPQFSNVYLFTNEYSCPVSVE